MESVRIVVVGDQGVGKTSLVLNLVQDFQSKGLPHKARPVNLPISHNTRTTVIDTSSRAGEKADVEKDIRTADFIVILYDINVPKTRDNVGKHWIPKIKSLREGFLTSLAVVGTKYDQCEDEGLKAKQLDEFKDFCDALLDEYEEIEFIMESSAKENRDAIEGIFERAREAVLYPTTPLIFDANITESFSRAIRRIFDILDNNGRAKPDELLDKEDLRTLRELAFEKKDSDEILAEALSRIEEAEAQYGLEKYAGLTKDRMITREGFVLFFKLLIEDDVSSVWTILRKYGYDRSLTIRDDYCLPKYKMHKDQKLALSESAYLILSQIFHKHCHKEEKYLDNASLARIFEPVPASVDYGVAWTALSSYHAFQGKWQALAHPWASLTFPYCCTGPQYDEANFRLSEEHFKAMWMMGMALDHRVVLKQFAYLGYSPATVQLTKFVSTSTCALIHAVVFGGNGAGKSSLIMAHQNSNSTPSEQQVETQKKMIQTLETERRHYSIHFRSDKWLLLEELPVSLQDEFLRGHVDIPFDVALIACDYSRHDSCVAGIQLMNSFLSLDLEKPSLLIQAKCDLVKSLPADQAAKTEALFAASRQFDVLPLSVLSKGAEVNEFYAKVIEMAVAYNTRGQANPLVTVAWGVGSLAGLVLATYLIKRLLFDGAATGAPSRAPTVSASPSLGSKFNPGRGFGGPRGGASSYRQ